MWPYCWWWWYSGIAVVVMVVRWSGDGGGANSIGHHNCHSSNVPQQQQHTHHRHMQTLSPYNAHPTQTPTLTFMHSTNYSHYTISLALPSTLTLMPNLIPTTLTSSPHMTTLSPIPTHYRALQIDLCTIVEQQFCYLMVSIFSYIRKSCRFFLHTKHTRN